MGNSVKVVGNSVKVVGNSIKVVGYFDVKNILNKVRIFYCSVSRWISLTVYYLEFYTLTLVHC